MHKDPPGKRHKDQHRARVFPNVIGELVVIGDQREKYKKELRKFFKEKYEPNPATIEDIIPGKKKKPHELNLVLSDTVALDMEPFEVLCRMLEKANKNDTIGGAPQMVKAYQYMNSTPVGVYWPNKDEKNDFVNRTILGRKLFDYEDTYYWFIDPTTLRTTPCLKKPKGQTEEP